MAGQPAGNVYARNTKRPGRFESQGPRSKFCGRVPTYRKGKSFTPEPASSKERLNKDTNEKTEWQDTLAGNALQHDRANSEEAAEIWTKVLDRLKSQVNAASYSTWLKH